MKKLILYLMLTLFPAATFALSLSNGWNLISSKESSSVAVADYFAASHFASGQQTFNRIWAWDNATNNWKIYSLVETVAQFNATNGTSFGEITTIDPNSGYWINMTQADTFTYSSSSSGSTSFTLSSLAVKEGNLLPMSYTCDGLDSTGTRGGVSPTLSIANAPSGTASFAITMHIDKGNDVESLWVLYNLPASTTTIPSVNADTAPAGGTMGISEQGAQAYFPPCSHEPVSNTYTITLYALSSTLSLDASTTTYAILKAAAEAAQIEKTTLELTNIRYNPDDTTDKQVPTSVPTTCAEKSAAFEAYSQSSVSCSTTTMTVTGTAIPSRSSLDGDKSNVGTTSWIGRVPLPDTTTWSFPLVPSYLSGPTSNITIHDFIGVTVDGIPILHYAKEASNTEVAQLNTDYSDRDTVLLGEIDQCGAHAGNGEDYHYHYAPVCMMDAHDPSKPLAYMFDGIPLYYGTGGGVATGSTSEVPVNYGAGRYSSLDYRPHAVKTGTESLNGCNAYDINGDGATSGYVYYTTKEAPYTIGCFMGTADQSSSSYTGPRWDTDRTLNWSGSQVLITDYYEDSIDSQTWTLMEMTPLSGNNQISSGDTGVVLYRQLQEGETGYVAGSQCWTFKYRADKSNTSNETVETVCRS